MSQDYTDSISDFSTTKYIKTNFSRMYINAHKMAALQWRHNGCLKSPASWLFTQPFVQAQIKENIKVQAQIKKTSPSNVIFVTYD